MKKTILLVSLVLIITACTLFGPKPPNTKGFYFIGDNRTYEEIRPYQSVPKKDQFRNLSQFTTIPDILFCDPQLQFDTITLANAIDYTQHDFKVSKEGDKCFDVIIEETLSDGVYCFSENDFLASPVELRHWCFVIGDLSSDDFSKQEDDVVNQESKNDDINEKFEGKTENFEEPLGEIIDLKLVSLSEEPADPGYKYLDFQVLIQNTSNDYWLNIRDWPHSYSSSITTAEGFQYDREYRDLIFFENGNEKVGDNLSNVATPTLYTLPPGFHTLVTRERWKVSEFATEAVLNIELEVITFIDEQESGERTRIDIVHEDDLPLVSENLTAYPKTPFIDNISWEEYKQRYSSDEVITLDVGDHSPTYDFGEMIFKGIHNDNRLDFNNLVVLFDIKNASLGYWLGLNWEFSDLVDGSIGFRKHLEHPISNLEGFSLGVAPGQTGQLGWTVSEDTSSTRNWENLYPYDYGQWEEPFCLIIQNLKWDREDIPETSATTVVKIVACQD